MTPCVNGPPSPLAPPGATPRATLLALALTLLLGAPPASAAPPPAKAEPAQQLLSDDGAYVIDRRSRLAWPRCVEGMVWDGKRCSGQPRRMSHGEAQALLAQRNKQDGGGWRLPRVRELQLLLRRGAQPGLDRTLFPAAPREWHWTGTANLEQDMVNPYNYGNIMQGRSSGSVDGTNFLQAWAVHMGSGEARPDLPKSQRLAVRLVLPLD